MTILVRVCVTLVSSEEANCVLQIATFSAKLEIIIMIITADDRVGHVGDQGIAEEVDDNDDWDGEGVFSRS